MGLSGFILNPWQTLETPTLVNAREEMAIAVSIVEFLDFEGLQNYEKRTVEPVHWAEEHATESRRATMVSRVSLKR